MFIKKKNKIHTSKTCTRCLSLQDVKTILRILCWNSETKFPLSIPPVEKAIQPHSPLNRVFLGIDHGVCIDVGRPQN